MSDQDARIPRDASGGGLDGTGRRYLAESLPADWSSPQPRRSASTPSRWDDELDDDDLPLNDLSEPASNPLLSPAAVTAPLGMPVPSANAVAGTSDAAASGETTASLETGTRGETPATGRPRWTWALVTIVLLAIVAAVALKLIGAW